MRFINVQLEKTGNKISSIIFSKDIVKIVFTDNSKMEILKDTFTDFYLYEGKDLSEEEILSIRKRNEIILIKKSALVLLSNKMYSCNELTNKLIDRNYSKELIDACLIDLQKIRLVDDEKLSSILVEEYNEKLYGEDKIKHLLKTRGINPKKVDQIEFEENLELDKCQALLKKYVLKKTNLSYSSLKINACSYLLNMGFKQRIISKTISLVEQMTSKEDDKEKLLKLLEKYVIIHQVDLNDKFQKEKIVKRYIAKGYNINIINECIEEIQWKN